jgi:hypothetical protein
MLLDEQNKNTQEKAHYDKLQLLRLNNLALENGLITQEVKQKVERKIWAK